MNDGRAPLVTLASSDGAHLEDDSGNRYFDLTSGWNVVNAGWNNRRIAKQWSACTESLPYRPSWSTDRYRAELQERLQEIAPGYGFVPSCTGSEAIDNALKLARLATGMGGVISIGDSYHGSTTGAAMAAGFDLEHLEPLGATIVQVRIPARPDEAQLADVEALIRDSEGVAALVFETVVTNAGCRRLEDFYLDFLQRMSREFGFLTICDEIGTGVNRTGSLLSCLSRGLSPDMIVCGKALTNGLYPLSGVLAAPDLALMVDETSFGSTFGGTSSGCAAAIATLDYHEEFELGPRAVALGQAFKERLSANASGSNLVGGISGEGLELCLHLDWGHCRAAGLTPRSLVSRLLDRGLFAVLSADDDLMLMPPLVADEKELLAASDRIFEILAG